MSSGNEVGGTTVGEGKGGQRVTGQTHTWNPQVRPISYSKKVTQLAVLIASEENGEPRTSSKRKLLSLFHSHLQREYGISIPDSIIWETPLGSSINSYVLPQLWVKNLGGKTHCALWVPQAPLPTGRFCKGCSVSCVMQLYFEKPILTPLFPPTHRSFFLAAPVGLHQLVHFSCLQLSKSQHISSLSFWSSCQDMDLQWQATALLWIQPNRGTWRSQVTDEGGGGFKKYKNFLHDKKNECLIVTIPVGVRI